MRPFYVGIDSEFKEKWILPFGVNDSILGSSFNVTPLNDSVYMGVGFKWETGEDQNSILMFFNSEGEELGYNQIYNDAIGPDITDNITGDVARLNDTLFITTALFGPGAGINANGEFIIDTAANIYKIEQRPNTRGRSVLVKTFDNKFTIGCNYKHSSTNYDIYLYKINDSLQHDTVYTGNYVYNSLCPYQIESGIIDITDCMIWTDVKETPSPGEYYAGLKTVHIKAYPNPIKEGEVTFSYLNTKNFRNLELKCFNIFGELVYEEKVYQYQGESKVNVSNWSKVMYIGVVYNNGIVVGDCKFVIQ